MLDGLEQLGAGLVGGQPGQPLQDATPLLVERGRRLLPLLEGTPFVVDPLLTLGDPVLAPLDVLALLVQVLVDPVVVGRTGATDQHDADDHEEADGQDQEGQDHLGRADAGR